MERLTRRSFVEKAIATGVTLFLPKVPALSARTQDVCEYTGEAWVGVCTYYSHAGCEGCSAGQIMANNEPFDENAMTIAFMRTPLNTLVEVYNHDNKLGVIARVTDRGGFEKYGILADLSLGVARAIGLVSKKSWIQISPVICNTPDQKPLA